MCAVLGVQSVYACRLFSGHKCVLESYSLPSTGVAIFAEVSARLTGGQLQQLVPLSLPLLLGVYQP